MAGELVTTNQQNPNGAALVAAPVNTPAAAPASFAHYTYAEIRQMAADIVGGGLFPHLKTPQQALSLMLLCQSKGLHPMQAVERYHIVSGRPAMKADAMLAEFQRQGGKVEWHERTDRQVSATFSHPSGGSLRVTWSLERAKQANLTGKDTWRQYPTQMLSARVISEGVRAVLPGVCMGIYTEEETADFAPVSSPAPALAPQQEAPALPPAPEESEAADALRKAMLAFARAAKIAGHDVASDENPGRPSASKMLMLYDAMTDEDREPEQEPTAQEWLEQAQRMAVWTRQHRAEAKAAVRDAVAADEDPFSEENQTPPTSAQGSASYRRTAPEPVIEGEVVAQEGVGANAPF